MALSRVVKRAASLEEEGKGAPAEGPAPLPRRRREPEPPPPPGPACAPPPAAAAPPASGREPALRWIMEMQRHSYGSKVHFVPDEVTCVQNALRAHPLRLKERWTMMAVLWIVSVVGVVRTIQKEKAKHISQDKKWWYRSLRCRKNQIKERLISKKIWK